MADEFLNNFSLFKDLTPDQRELIRPLFKQVECSPGTLLFNQGDPAENFYLVAAGEIHIRFKPDDGPEIIVARVKPGGIVGWSAALGNRFYTSAAICTVNCSLLRVRGNNMRALCALYPETGDLLLERLALVIAERLSSTHQEVMSLLKYGMLNGAQTH